MKRLPKFTQLLAVALICLLVAACDEDSKPTKSIDAGEVITADAIPTSFNESIKSTIKTSKGVFMVRGMPSVMIGENGQIDIYDNDRKYLCFEGWKKCRRLSN